MRTTKEIRRVRLQQLADEHARGKGAPLGARLGKDRRQMSAWLSGRVGISDETAREFENYYMKPSGWLDNEGEAVVNAAALPQQVSHFAGIDPDILHEAETLVLSDELQAGKKYPPRARARQLAQAYALLLSEGGRLSASTNARYVDSVNERTAGGDDGGEEATERRTGAGARGA